MAFYHDPFSPKAAAKLDGAPDEPDEPVQEPENDEEVKKGTVKEVEAWVGDDKERAQRALDAENESGEPRKSLVKALEDLLDSE